MDNIAIEILEDGTLKISTDRISMGNHVGAENLLREMSKLAGGETTRTRKVGADLRAALHEHTKDGHTHDDHHHHTH